VSAVADFDGGPEPAPSLVEPEPAAPSFQTEAAEHSAPAAAPPAPQSSAAEEAAHEADKAARRRSTVREKVSFTSGPAPSAAPVMPASAEQPGTAETAPAGVSEQPRKAGWWSRRFGGGE
jgi:ribonuclease E